MDRQMGLALYSVFPGGTPLDSRYSDDFFWRFLALEIFPDLVNARSSGTESWFFGSRWRQWLRRVWWWVHLCWQGSEEATERVLQPMTTDTIAQLVERPGMGFRLDLTRRFAQQFLVSGLHQDDFRRVMRVNTALLVNTEPLLVQGGVEAYVAQLVESIVRGS